MGNVSAGILVYRIVGGASEVLLVHPGGPYWAKKQEGAWSIPKGEAGAGEGLLEAARRELFEETGLKPDGEFIPLAPVKLKSGKSIHAWAIEGDADPATLRSNTFELEWPPKSGRTQQFPEADAFRFCTPAEARRLLNPAQVALVEELERILAARRGR